MNVTVHIENKFSTLWNHSGNEFIPFNKRKRLLAFSGYKKYIIYKTSEIQKVHYMNSVKKKNKEQQINCRLKYRNYVLGICVNVNLNSW